MFDQVEYVFLVRPDSQDVSIFGPLPSQDVRRAFDDLFQPRPAARKDGKSLIVSVPLDGNIWCIWRLGAVPTVTQLPNVLKTIAELSRGFAAPKPIAVAGQVGAQTGGAPLNMAEAALADLPRLRRRNAKILVARLTAVLVEKGACTAAMIVAVKQGRQLKTWVSDASLTLVQGQLAAAYAQYTDAPSTVDARSEAPQDFETVLIAQKIAAQTITFYPVKSGYGLILVDQSAQLAPPLAAEVAAAMQFSRPISIAPFLSQSRKRILAGLAAVLALWLVWPAPTWLTVTGNSVPDSTVTASLPTDATLLQMLVSVGMDVTIGQPLARLFSASLQERRAQEILSINVEELSAQAAMAENNFGAFQLAQKRGEIAKTRLAQLEARIAELTVKAPVAGWIVAAVPGSDTGAALQAGSPIAQIQTKPAFLVRLNPARVDARILTVGLSGQIYFRGLADRTYEIKMITPPVATMDRATGTEKLEAFAQVLTPDDGRLMGGLSGYARISGPRQMRIFSLTRYMAEYIRVQAWTYLGLAL